MTRYWSPPLNCSVHTFRSSLELSTWIMGVPGGNWHRTQHFAARSLKWRTQKWPFDNPLCAHLSVAWRVSSPRPLGFSAGGPRLLESTVWTLGSASWAALGNKIWRRVHWEPKTWSLESDWKTNEEVIYIYLKLVSRFDINIINQLSSREFHQ